MTRTIPAVLALFILGAHFLRQGGLETFAVCLVVPVVALFWRRRWLLRFWQFLLAFGTFIWVSTAVELTQERIAEGRAFLRMAVILSVVGAVTAFSGWLLNRRAQAWRVA